MSPQILHNHPLETWFGCGGPAHRLARPASLPELHAGLAFDRELKVFGDGANTLIADAGVSELIVELSSPIFCNIEVNKDHARISAGAGADFAKVINNSVRAGLAGLEGLSGIPATVGGAVAMNAGGAVGEIGPRIHRLHALNRHGHEIQLAASELTFDYRRSSAAQQGLIITEVEFQLHSDPDGPDAVRARQLDVMAYKKNTQPMSAHSAGCTFKNPTLPRNIPELGEKATQGARLSAGLLLDRAGCKGLRVGHAEVSPHHANFFIAHPGCTATDLIELMRRARAQVQHVFALDLEPEIKLWGASL